MRVWSVVLREGRQQKLDSDRESLHEDAEEIGGLRRENVHTGRERSVRRDGPNDLVERGFMTFCQMDTHSADHGVRRGAGRTTGSRMAWAP